jgi:hypothetical protein
MCIQKCTLERKRMLLVSSICTDNICSDAHKTGNSVLRKGNYLTGLEREEFLLYTCYMFLILYHVQYYLFKF